MGSIFGILNTGRLGLYAQQRALSLTGQNIANANTDGYTRQTAQLEAMPFGGVKVAQIARVTDPFLVAQLRDAIARLNASQTLTDQLSRMETALGDANQSPVGQGLSDFFDALQDLTAAPNGSTEREALRTRARQLIFALDSTARQLRSQRGQLDLQVGQQVEQVNALATSIAALNRQIAAQRAVPGDARTDLNRLLDERDRLLEQMAAIVPVRAIEGEQGAMTLFVAGEVVVEGDRTRPLQLRVDPANDHMSDVTIADAAGRPVKLNERLTEGSLGALLRARDDHARDLIRQVDRLAATLVRDVNAQHRLGTGLDGVSGRDFFTGLAVTASPSGSNRGGAAVASTAVVDPAQLDFQDYEIRFTAPGAFDVVNASTGQTVLAGVAYTPGGAIEFAGMRVVLDNASGPPAAGDRFVVNAYSGTTARMDLSAAVAADAGAIAAGLSDAPGDNRNALALTSLQQAATMGVPPSQSFGAFFDAARMRLAMDLATAQQTQSVEAIAQQQAQSLRESIAGVSIDDEATNIIQFQRAFEASSRVIRMTDELLATLLQMI